LRQGNWAYSSGSLERLHDELAEKTIGLLGYGHIGKAIAMRAKAFEMKVHVANRSAVATSSIIDRAFTLDKLHEFWASADFFVVSVPLAAETTGIVDAAAFAAMRATAVVVNVGRGPTIDERSLYDALKNGRIAGAIIDTWFNYPTPETVAAQIHETVAPYLLGKDPLTIDAHSNALLDPYLGFASTSAEIRAASAVDIALWDLWGKALGRPVYELLGGPTREKIRVYNTCAGYAYNQAGGARRVVTARRGDEPVAGPYDDQVAFTRQPAELAQSLLDMGITAMKIWPFDPFAIASGGRDISAQDLQVGLEPFRKIRTAVGN